MKKENRKAAQERRAKEREAEARKKKARQILVPVIIIAAIAVLVIGIVVSGVKSNQNAQTTSNSVTATSGELSSTSDSSAQSTSVSSTATSSSAPVLDTTAGLEAKAGDTVNIDYVGKIDGVAFDGGSTNGQGTDLVLGSGTYIDNFEEQIEGHVVGETFDVTVTFPKDYGVSDLAGKEAVFTTTLNGIYK